MTQEDGAGSHQTEASSRAGLMVAVTRRIRGQSLRSWMLIAMVCAVLPLLISALTGYSVYHRTIVQPFRDVMTRQHDVLLEFERIQSGFWTLSSAMNKYALTGDEAYREVFEATRQRVEEEFRNIEANAGSDPHLRDQLTAMRAIWSRLSRDAQEVLTWRTAEEGSGVSNVAAALAVEQEFPVAANQLESVLMRIRDVSEANHARALEAFRRLEYWALAAILVSIGMMVLGGYIVNRAIVLSADQLVAGARRVSSGEHGTPVQISVPPELAAVADAFNRMTKKIVEQETRLVEQARRDGLTSLLNRREFDLRLEERMDSLAAGGAPFALLLGDVDHFKQINDAHGHVTGDEVLRRVAQTLEANAPDAENTFRYGGEEFALILPDSSPEMAQQTAERLRRAIGELTPSDAALPDVTMSFGLAFCDAPLDPDALVRSADAALYEAKAQGRNRVVTSA
ncbi:GGDEF domain-containing protein [Cereibacter changlensis]|nr:diguanylate cyclase [Cereibacter changlensis]